jgi:hypothetical protein
MVRKRLEHEALQVEKEDTDDLIFYLFQRCKLKLNFS